MIRADARDVRQHVDDHTIAAVVTSPPYLEQRVYGPDDRELGHEGTITRTSPKGARPKWKPTTLGRSWLARPPAG